jgi:hypothetical protein
MNISMTTAEANHNAASLAEPGATTAPEKATARKSTSRKMVAPKAKKTATGAKSKKAARAAKKSGGRATSRSETMGGKILEMIRRAKGATLAEIVQATSWQAHSVRGFISTASKKHGVKIESSKNEGGGRVYRITN